EYQCVSTDPLQVALKSSKEAVDQRATEAETLFGPIAGLLDQYYSSNPHIPARQSRAFKKFYDEIVEIASKHFESYIQGAPASNPRTTSPLVNPITHDVEQNPTPIQSYANVLKRNTHPTPTTGKNITRISCQHHTSKQQTDDRLFLRLPMDSPLRAHSGYALQTILKSKLGSDGDLISNILPTKTGFALCPSKGKTDALKEKILSVNSFGDARIEKASPWTSYRISNVPRSYGAINEDLEHCLLPVTTHALQTAVTAAAANSPISVTSSRNNEINPESSSTSWIVPSIQQICAGARLRVQAEAGCYKSINTTTSQLERNEPLINPNKTSCNKVPVSINRIVRTKSTTEKIINSSSNPLKILDNQK
ncbi:hypothetical protein EPUL_006380, partial [Erysiphe pulchra]